MASNHIEFKENKKRIYFANACDICKKEGVFLLDNMCSDCIENHCKKALIEGTSIIRKHVCFCLKDNIWNDKAEMQCQEIKSIPIASSRPNREVKALKFSKLKD